MTAGPPRHGLETAIAVLGYRWAMRGREERPADEIAAVELLRQAVAAFPPGPVPLAELYPAVVRLAASSLDLLAQVGDPDEVDGLKGFEGFALWRDSR